VPPMCKDRHFVCISQVDGQLAVLLNWQRRRLTDPFARVYSTL
jgi:hypothetical protein